MEEVIRVSAEQASKELLKRTNVTISLEGWPCAFAVIGLGVVYVIVSKIKSDSQCSVIDSQVMGLKMVS